MSTAEKPWRDEAFMLEWAPKLNNVELADRFGGSETRYRAARKVFGIPKFDPAQTVDIDSSLQQEIIRLQAELQEALVLSPTDRVERDKRVMKLSTELSELKSDYKCALKESTLGEEIVELAQEIMPALKTTYAPAIIKKREGKTIETAVLGIGDWHLDANIDSEIMEGLNSFNPFIGARRAENMVDSTLNLLLNHHSGTVFDEMCILDVGDGITGPLHEENKYTNAMPPFEAIIMCAELKSRCILDLAAQMPKVTFIGVPGNHWRYTPKVSFGMPTENSDWLIYQFMARRLSEAKNVEVIVPKAWSAVMEIKVHGFGLNHGYTDAKGGFGCISWYSLTKSDSKRTAIDQRLNRKVDYRVYGHIHNDAIIGRTVKGQIIVLPSLCGGDAYAKEGMAGTFSEAGQMLWGVHEQRGKTWVYDPLTVTDYDTNESCRYDDVIPL